jgi:WD40 repeat protein
MTSIPHATKKETYLITASFDRSIKVFSIEQQYRQVKEYQNAHDDYSLYALDAMYDDTKGVVVISGCFNLQEIKLWYVDLNEDEGKEKIHIKVDGKVCCVKYNNNAIYVGSTQGVFMYLMEGIDKEGKANKSFVDANAVAPKKGELKHTAITFMDNNDKWMVEADSMGVVRVWDVEGEKMEKVIKREMNEFQINSLSTWDNVYIIAGARDGKVVLYDVEQGECVDSVGEHKGYVYCVKVIKHWKYNKAILSCGYDGQVKLWGSTK